MTETPFVAPKPNAEDFMSRQPSQDKPENDVPDPDRFLKKAKQIVVDNFNVHLDPKAKPLTENGVYIVWFSKTLGNWKAVIASPIHRSMFWEVTYNGHRGEAYLDIYKKISNVRIPTGGFAS